MKYFAKPVPTQAIQLTFDMSYEKWGSLQEAKAGDWLLSKEGDTYTCAAEVFAETYVPLSDKNGWYYKQASVEADEAVCAGSVSTLEGVSHYEAGDMIITNPGGDQYCMSKSRFADLYDV